MSNLNFKDFMKSKKHVESLRAELGDYHENSPGYIYANSCFIELHDGKAYLCIENCEYRENDAVGIEGLERILHKWYFDNA